jgi:hypothetical protein
MTVVHSTRQWRIGDIKLTRIVEAEGLRAPEYMFRDLTPDMVREQVWLRPDFATEAGQLISSIHAFVIETRDRRIIVDTCIGNDKARRMPRWNMLQTAFLSDLAAAGYPAERIDTGRRPLGPDLPERALPVRPNRIRALVARTGSARDRRCPARSRRQCHGSGDGF